MEANEAFIARSSEPHQRVLQISTSNCVKCKKWKIITAATIFVAVVSIFAVIPSKPLHSRNTRETPVIKYYKIKWSKHVQGQQPSYSNTGFLVLEGTRVKTYDQDRTTLKSKPGSEGKMSTEETASTSESLILQNPCSPSSIISKILKESETQMSMFQDERKNERSHSLLQNYRTLIDGSLRVIYIEAEVRFSSLGTGCDPNEYGIVYAKRYGEPGDIPTHFISKKLGGDGESRNVYPANPNADFGKSEIHQNLVYDHVKKGGDRFAKLFFGVIFEEEIEGEDENGDINYFRPKEIVYKFELYEDDKIVGDLLEGKIINMLP